MKKFIYLFIVISISVAISVTSLFYFWQEKIIFHPESTYHPPPKSYNIKRYFVQYGDSDTLHLWHFKNNSFYPTVLFFSGNSYNISHNIFHLDLFKKLGLNAVLFDYSGYGSSSGSINSEKSFYDSGDAAFKYLLNNLKIPEDQIIFWGYSLGAPVSLKTLQEKRIKAIILESSLTSIKEISNLLYPFFPVSYFLKYDFNSYKTINSNSSPILIIHSIDDEIISYKLANKLYTSINRSNKEVLTINGSHSLGSYDSYNKYYTGIRKFLKSIN